MTTIRAIGSDGVVSRRLPVSGARDADPVMAAMGVFATASRQERLGPALFLAALPGGRGI